MQQGICLIQYNDVLEQSEDEPTGLINRFHFYPGVEEKELEAFKTRRK